MSTSVNKPAGRSGMVHGAISMTVIGAVLMVVGVVGHSITTRTGHPDTDLMIAAAFIIGVTILLIGCITWVSTLLTQHLHRKYGDTGPWFTRVEAPVIAIVATTVVGVLVVSASSIYAEVGEVDFFSSAFTIVLLGSIIGSVACTIGVVSGLAYSGFVIVKRLVKGKS